MSGEHTHPDLETQISTVDGALTSAVARIDAAVAALDSRVTALEGGSEPPPPPPPTGTVREVRAGDNLAVAVNTAPAGTIIRLLGDNQLSAPIVPVTDDLVVDLGPYAVSPGAGFAGVTALKGNVKRLRIDGGAFSGFVGAVPNIWHLVGDDPKYAISRTLMLRDMTDYQMLGTVVEDNDSGIQIGRNGVHEHVISQRNKHRNWYGNSVSGGQFTDCESHDANLSDWFRWQWDAAFKFVSCTNMTFDGWVAKGNHGPGWWFDGGGGGVTVTDMDVRDNETGFFWEINGGSLSVDGLEAHNNNGGQANVVISGSEGTSSVPLLLKNVKTSGHTQWEYVVKLTPRHAAGHIRLENAVLDTGAGSKPAVLYRQGLPTPPGLELVNVRDQTGKAISSFEVL